MGCCCLRRQNQLDDSQEDLISQKVRIDAEGLKQQGNKNFKKRLYQNAIKCYQKALTKNPKQIVYYTNLALAYKSNRQYKQSIATIDRLIRMTDLSLRPDGQTLFQKGKITKCRSVILLTKQYILGQKYSNIQTQKNLQILNQALSLLNQIKKTEQFQKQAEQYLKNSYKIKKYLTDLTKNMNEEKQILEYLNKKLKLTQNQNYKKNDEKWAKVSMHYPTSAHILKELERLIKTQRQNQLYQNQDEQYILDPITYETFQRPVIVPSGITYDEIILKQHFAKNGYKDPITKQEYTSGQRIIVRNNNLQDYILGMSQQKIKKEQIQLMIC